MTEIDIYKALKKFFGFTKFKGLQEEVIKSLLDKHNTFVIMPTGGGKSLCFQLPALVEEGTAIVVSPLIALMKNQVDSLRAISSEEGVAHVLNSSLNKTEVKQVKSDIINGLTKLLYVAPESLTKDENVEFLQSVKISFVAIDEAHCISEWGHDFRPEYRNLKNIIKRIDKNIPIIGLTATATPKVQEDILKNLGMQDANTFKASFNRPNLYYEVRPKTKNIDADIIRFIKKNDGKSGIVYCLSRKRVEQLSLALQVNGIKAVPYHAGLDSKTRVRHQDMFLMEDTDVVDATIIAVNAKKSCIVNIGTGIGTTFNELVNVLNEVLGTNLKTEYFDMPYNPKTYQSNTQADTKKAEESIGFKAKWTLKDGISDYFSFLDKDGWDNE